MLNFMVTLHIIFLLFVPFSLIESGTITSYYPSTSCTGQSSSMYNQPIDNTCYAETKLLCSGESWTITAYDSTDTTCSQTPKSTYSGTNNMCAPLPSLSVSTLVQCYPIINSVSNSSSSSTGSNAPTPTPTSTPSSTASSNAYGSDHTVDNSMLSLGLFVVIVLTIYFR